MSTIPSRETKREPKRFAPLDPAAQNGQHLPKLKGIIFDVDGTLCLPQNYMFKEMRSALGIPKSVDIIDHIRSLSNQPDVGIINGHQPPEPHSSTNTNQPPLENMMSHSADSPDPPLDSPQARAVKKIKDIERQAMTSQRPQPGLQELMAYLTRRGVRKALCTRNFPAPVHHLLSNHLPDEEFHPVVTRETEGIQPKPSPEGLWSIAQAWGLDKEVDESPDKLVSTNDGEEIDPLELARQYLGSGLIMVGDSVDDMAAGYRAGAASVLLVNDENEDLAKHAYTGRTVRRLDELIDILEQGFAENLK
ncbi:phosphoglycolate phosphatase [Exophiala viscosa]|uniref:Phosphoglycolate phosphatase n=1 Tax=Exophiala viscosa TaxID=2486360 RepID=A0AAN6I959_9EURO|nr:phosphoglycolate phosphatase [Exophiala viscosa]